MKTLLIAAAVLLLAACSGSSQPDAPPPATDQAAHNTPAKPHSALRNTPLAPLIKAEDKARNVENVLKKADQKRRKQLEGMTGG